MQEENLNHKREQEAAQRGARATVNWNSRPGSPLRLRSGTSMHTAPGSAPPSRRAVSEMTWRGCRDVSVVRMRGAGKAE